jgi:hypothetical protein
MAKAKRDLKRVSAHVPPEMKAWLQEKCDRNLSSLNVEVVAALRFKMESEQRAEKAS